MRDSLARDGTNGDVSQRQTKTSRRMQPGVQDDASRRVGLQNGNPRDYCTYKRFTVCGPFAEPKGGRGRYGNRQAEASTYPSISPDASRRLRRLSLSLRQVILLLLLPSCSFHRAARPSFLLVFLSPLHPPVFLRGRCASSSRRSLFRVSNVVASRCARWSRLSRFFSSATEFPMNKKTNDTLTCDIVIGLPCRFWPICFEDTRSCMYVREHKIWHEGKHHFLHFYFLRIKYSSLNRKMLWMVRMIVHRFKRHSILISGCICICKINLNSINRFLTAVSNRKFIYY